MSTIYAVSSGDYSDYRVVAVFSTRAKAGAFIAAIPDSEWNEIEVYELDPDTADLIKDGYALWRVLMLRDGTVESIEKSNLGRYCYSVTNCRFEIWRRSQAPAYRGKGIPDCLVGTAMAKSAEHAIKIVNEKRTQLIASNRWKP